ncbi:MAG: dihydrofolate reductase [Bacteroidota bacterium]
MEKILIAAQATNRVIGNQGKLPWHLPDDLRFFKKMTSGHAIIMGRKTYESIGYPLPNRLNIVLTRNRSYIAHANCWVAYTLDQAFFDASKAGMSKAFVIGGAKVYQEAVASVSKMYITEIGQTVQGDTYFPTIDWKAWKLVSKKCYKKDQKHAVDFCFLCYERTLSAEELSCSR